MTSDLENFFEYSPDLHCILNASGAFARVNRAFTSLLGWSGEETRRTNFLDYIHPEEIEEARSKLLNLSAEDPAASLQTKYRCKDNTYRALRWSFTRVDELLFGNGHQVSEQVQTYDLFKLLIENSPTGIILVDDEGVIHIANREAARIFGYTQDELINQSVEILLPGKIRQKHARQRNAYARQPRTYPMGIGRDLYGRHKDGHQIEVEIGLNPVHTAQGIYILSTIIDLTERKRSEESLIQFTEQLEESIQQLSVLASTDSLTRLKNRRAFSEHFNLSIQTAMQKRDSLSLMLLDIDEFKAYNDTFGHPAGDYLLSAIAQLLQRISRAGDFIARIGGEEFAVILPGTETETSKRIARRYLREFNKMEWPHRRVTASIGVVSHFFQGKEELDPHVIAAQLFQQADQSLYLSKSKGKNQATHYDEVKLNSP